MKRVLVHLLLLGTILSSCTEVKEVEFKKISNLGFTLNGPMVTADLTFFNPNNFSMLLKRSEVEILFNGKFIGRIDQDHQMKINKQAEFTVPIKAQFSLKDLGLGSALMGILGGKKYPLRFQGKIFGQVRGIPVSVKVDHVEEIQIGK